MAAVFMCIAYDLLTAMQRLISSDCPALVVGMYVHCNIGWKIYADPDLMALMVGGSREI